MGRGDAGDGPAGDASPDAGADATDGPPDMAAADAGGGDDAADGGSCDADAVVLLGGALPPLVGELGGQTPAIVVGADGLPVVVWSTIGPSPFAQRVIAQRWTGANWDTLGTFPDVPSTGHLQDEANVGFDGQGNVIVAWTDQDTVSGPFAVRVRVRNGGAWQSWDDGLPAGYRPYLAVDDGGEVSLSMTVGPGMDRTAVFRRQAGSWMMLGDLMNANLPRLQNTGNMAGDGDGVLEVVWSDLGTTAQFAPDRRRWEGGAWQTPPAPPVGTNSSIGPIDLRVGVSHAGVVAFSWGDQAPPQPETVAVFMPGWSAPRAVTGFTGVAQTDIDVDPMGLPLVTFARSTPQALQVERWSGTGWEAVFDDVHVSPTTDGVPTGRLALASTGRPFLAIQEHAAGQSSIYVLTKACASP